MNSRERVMAAVERREPDRVPIDFGATRQTGIMAGACHKLKKYLGLDSETFVYDLYQMLAEVEEPLRRRMHSDAVALFFKRVCFDVPNQGRQNWRLRDGTPVKISAAFELRQDNQGNTYVMDRSGRPVAKMPPGGYYFDPLEKGPGAAHLDPDKWVIPLLPDDELRFLEDQARFWRENSDYAVIGELRVDQLFFNMGTNGFDDWMVTLYTEPEYVRELYEKALEGMIQNFDLYYQAVGDKMDIVKFCDDFGTQTGEFADPSFLRETVLPFYRRFISHIKAADKRLKVLHHCCGSIFYVLKDLIEIGVDIINPVQTSAKNMEPHRLKSAYGDKVCFWGGGVETQGVLPFGSPEEVASQVAERIEVFKPGGGFVFNTIHNIQENTPPENIVAAFDTAYEKGGY